MTAVQELRERRGYRAVYTHRSITDVCVEAVEGICSVIVLLVSLIQLLNSLYRHCRPFLLAPSLGREGVDGRGGSGRRSRVDGNTHRGYVLEGRKNKREMGGGVGGTRYVILRKAVTVCKRLLKFSHSIHSMYSAVYADIQCSTSPLVHTLCTPATSTDDGGHCKFTEVFGLQWIHHTANSMPYTVFYISAQTMPQTCAYFNAWLHTSAVLIQVLSRAST